jgi:uncharacterized protein (TIGR00730 family)
MPRSVCVFCASSKKVDAVFVDAARELGRLLGECRDTLIWGGTDSGTMGVLADAVRASGGKAVGIIPTWMRDRGIGYEQAEELIAVDDMRRRKTEMEIRSDAFITLAGGIGTLEELVEVVTLRYLKQHRKPIILINTAGFYDPLLAFFRQMHEMGFAREPYDQHFQVAADPAAALAALEAACPV